MNENSHKEPNAIPYSGQIIGAIVEALDIKDDILTDKTAKRYYSGTAISEYSLKQIYIALGRKLVEVNIVPVPMMFEKHGTSMPMITAASLARLAKKWDGLCAMVQSRSSTVQDSSQAIEGFCRLIIIDLALRAVAWFRLANLPPFKPITPQWAEENGPGKTLRTLLSKAGITRSQFSARVEVSDVSIDNWLDGKVRPTPKNIEIMAEAFSRLIPDSNKCILQVQFQRQFTLAYLSDIIADKIGREAVLELASALYRFTWLISEDIKAMKRPPIEEVAGTEFQMLRFGTDEPTSHVLLRNLASVEQDGKWRKEILAATTSWELRFEEIAGENSFPAASAGLAQELPEEFKKAALDDGTEQDLKRLGETNSLQPNDYQLIAAGDFKMLLGIFDRGINDRRLIVKRHPRSPQAHMELGAFLGMVGKHRGDRNLVNEGINECKIAAALCRDWDTPLVEPGIILINIGRYDEALKELENAANKLPKMTPHLAMNRGYAFMQTNKLEQALVDFEFVIQLRPNYARALDCAAYCSFMTNDHVKGMKYAKEARKYGEPRTYDDWRRGVYKSK